MSFDAASSGDQYLDQGGRGVEPSRDASYPNIVVQPAGTVLNASGNSVDYYSGASGLDVYFNITALTGTTPSLTVTIQGKDPVSGQYYTILASAAVTTAVFTHLQAVDGIAVAANLTANMQMPPIWRLAWTIGGSAGPTVTCSISATPLP